MGRFDAAVRISMHSSSANEDAFKVTSLLRNRLPFGYGEGMLKSEKSVNLFTFFGLFLILLAFSLEQLF